MIKLGSRINTNNIKLLPSILVLLSLGGCSVYQSHFGCSDAKGACCTPMHVVDRMITSGEISTKIEKPPKKSSRIYKSKDKDLSEEDDLFTLPVDTYEEDLEAKATIDTTPYKQKEA